MPGGETVCCRARANVLAGSVTAGGHAPSKSRILLASTVCYKKNEPGRQALFNLMDISNASLPTIIVNFIGEDT